MSEGKECSFCGEIIRGSAKTCPRCGQNKSGSRNYVIALAAALLVNGAVYFVVPGFSAGVIRNPFAALSSISLFKNKKSNDWLSSLTSVKPTVKTPASKVPAAKAPAAMSDEVTGMYEAMGISKKNAEALQNMYKDTPVFGENTEKAAEQAADLYGDLLNSFFGGSSDETAKKKK